MRHPKKINRVVVTLGAIALAGRAIALDIQFPPETGAFKQDAGAELANGQCLVCHSVEYVTTQPPMARPFWKASVQKMQQKYGAPITDAQIEPLVDYLTRNYGLATNALPGAAANGHNTISTPAEQPAKTDPKEIAMKYGCFTCHNTKAKVIGPAYREIAVKYQADPAALSKIEQQIHKGGSGKWGPIIMPPFPQVTAAETKVLADWIMGLK